MTVVKFSADSELDLRNKALELELKKKRVFGNISQIPSTRQKRTIKVRLLNMKGQEEKPINPLN